MPYLPSSSHACEEEILLEDVAKQEIIQFGLWMGQESLGEVQLKACAWAAESLCSRFWMGWYEVFGCGQKLKDPAPTGNI